MQDKSKKAPQYDDIINLQHHVSCERKHMSIRDRAAQFSPFAAVTGYDTAIKETARLTDQKIELDENEKNLLNEKLRLVQEQLNNQEEIELVYFQADDIKSGGRYVSLVGSVKKIEEYDPTVVMQDGTRIPIEEIIDLKGQIFHILDDFFA